MLTLLLTTLIKQIKVNSKKKQIVENILMEIVSDRIKTKNRTFKI